MVIFFNISNEGWFYPTVVKQQIMHRIEQNIPAYIAAFSSAIHAVVCCCSTKLASSRESWVSHCSLCQRGWAKGKALQGNQKKIQVHLFPRACLSVPKVHTFFLNSTRRTIIRFPTARILQGLWMRGKLGKYRLESTKDYQSRLCREGGQEPPGRGCRQMALSWWLSAKSQENNLILKWQVTHYKSVGSIQGFMRSPPPPAPTPFLGGSWWTIWCKKIQDKFILLFSYGIICFPPNIITTFTKQTE